MDAKDLTNQFISYYRENLAELNRWGGKLLEETDPIRWAKLLSERSIAIRELFAENERNLTRLRGFLPKEPTEYEAECLYELLLTMSKEEMHDFAVMSRVGDVIIPYFEKTKQYGPLVASLSIVGAEHTIFYRLVSNEENANQALDYFRRAIALKDHYEEMQDPYARSAIFRCYRNLIMFMGHFRRGSFAEGYQIYQEMTDFYHSEAVQKKDGESEEFMHDVETSHMEACMSTMALIQMDENLSEEGKEWQRRFLEEDMQEMSDHRFLDPITEELLRIHKGEITEYEMMDSLVRQIEGGAPEIDWSHPEDPRQVGMAFQYFNLTGNLLEMMNRSSLSEEEKQSLLDRFLKDATEFVFSVPYQYHADMMNSLMSEWYGVLQPHLPTGEEKIQVLLKLIIRRQPITYIHSLMVAKLAREIASESVRKCPEDWIGILGCKTVGEVEARTEELVTYAYRCGLLHDVGKCYITDVINRQNRALDGNEFGLIRKHPMLGPEIVCRDKELSPYFDVMMGHHKYYDGTKGYPEEFDNVHSPIRILIDLVTISDSMDAATDVLGRNYTAGKDFAHLFQELREGAGTRYNPNLVRLLEEDEALQKRLAYLTSDGRYEIYREAYQEIMN